MAHPFARLGRTLLSVLGSPEAITVRTWPASAGWDSTGRFSVNAYVDTPTTAVIHPLDNRKTESPPEGQRPMERIQAFTLGLVAGVSVAAQGKASHILWSGREYEVTAVDDWTVQAGYARLEAVLTDASVLVTPPVEVVDIWTARGPWGMLYQASDVDGLLWRRADGDTDIVSVAQAETGIATPFSDEAVGPGRNTAVRMQGDGYRGQTSVPASGDGSYRIRMLLDLSGTGANNFACGVHSGVSRHGLIVFPTLVQVRQNNSVRLSQGATGWALVDAGYDASLPGSEAWMYVNGVSPGGNTGFPVPSSVPYTVAVGSSELGFAGSVTASAIQGWGFAAGPRISLADHQADVALLGL